MAEEVDEIISCMSYVIRKTFWSFWIFLKFVLLRILDLLGLVFNILACLTIVRLPCMIRQFLDMDSLDQWRFDGIIHCLIFLMDIPIMLMFLILIPFTLGIPLIRDIQRKDIKSDYFYKNSSGLYFGGFKLRWLIITHFVRLIADLFCIPFGLIVLLSWRSCRVIKMAEEWKWEKMEWRLRIIIEFLQLFLDIPCIVVGLLILPTWQFFFLIKDIKKMISEDESWNTYRFLTFMHFLLFLLDVVCIILFVLTCFTWRAPMMVIKLKKKERKAWTVREIIVQQFSLIFVDIPFLLCGLIVVLTLWRLPKLISHIRKCKKDEWEIRLVCLVQVAMILVDFFCFLLSLFILVTLWRLYPLVRDIVKYWKRNQTSNTVEHRSNDNVVLKTVSWKIRVSIFKHCALVLVDIPALVCSVFILFTIVRFPKLFAKLLQSGDFYMEFALITYQQMWKLIVDFVFLILFIVLMILRPVQSWIEVLEDDDHKKTRLLKFYKQWIPDIVKKRHLVYQALDEEFSSCIKHDSLVYEANAHFSIIIDNYLAEYLWVVHKIKKYNLSPKYKHSLSTVFWWETRRVHKMTRLYMCERNFMVHPDVNLHDENLSLHRNEMVKFEAKVTEAYKELEGFIVQDVPLWSENSGLSTRSRAETQKVLIKCLPRGRFLLWILIFLNLLPLYRFPSLVVHLFQRWYDRRRIVFSSCKEYWEDLKTVLWIALIFALIYRAPWLFVDIIYDIFYKRSLTAVRKSVRRYPPLLLDDLISTVAFIFSWRSVRFVVTAALFGVIMPASLFLRISKFAISSRCGAYLTAFTLYLIFTSFPFIFSFQTGHTLVAAGHSSMINIAIGVFTIFLMLCLVIMVFVQMKKLNEDNFSINPMAYDYVRFNFANTHAVIGEMLEFFQLVALIFSIGNFPLIGSNVLNTISSYLLLNFATFEFKLGAVMVLFMIWFISCGAPVILEEILDELPKRTCAGHPGWRLLLSIFANTLFVTITESMCSLLACDYQDCYNTVNITDISGLHDNQTNCASARLIDNPSIVCWEGNHRFMAMLGLWGLMWYTSTALLFGIKYGDSDHPQLDLKFSPLYDIFINFIKAFMVGAVIFGSSKPLIALSLMIFLSMTAFFLTLLLKKCGVSPCNSTELMIGRSASFLMVTIVASSVITAVILDDPVSYIPVWIIIGGLSLTFIVAIVLTVRLQILTDTQKSRRDFREEILALEKRLFDGKMMVTSWRKQRKKWKRLAKNVKQAHKQDYGYKKSDWNAVQVVVVPTSTEVSGSEVEPQLPPPSKNISDVSPPSCMPPMSDSSSIGMYSLNYNQEHSPEVSGSMHLHQDEKQNIHVTGGGMYFPHPDEVNSLRNRCLRPFQDVFDGIQMHDGGDGCPEERSINPLICNGQNLLLILQDNIHYTAFSYSFISQLSLWRGCVSNSNWEGLCHCLTVLTSSLTQSFYTPSDIDKAVAGGRFDGFSLTPDTQMGEPEIFVEEHVDLEYLREISHQQRKQVLEDLSETTPYGIQLKQLFDRVLPSLPVIKEWNFEAHETTCVFDLVLSKSVNGTIKEIGPNGVKLAKGAVISLAPQIKGYITDGKEIHFDNGFEPKGKKGPFKAAVSEASFVEANDKLYIMVQEKKVPFRNVLDSLQEVVWK